MIVARSFVLPRLWVILTESPYLSKFIDDPRIRTVGHVISQYGYVLCALKHSLKHESYGLLFQFESVLMLYRCLLSLGCAGVVAVMDEISSLL